MSGEIKLNQELMDASMQNLKAMIHEDDEISISTLPSDAFPMQRGGLVATGEETVTRMLGLPKDVEHVNALHCFVRSECVQVYSVTPQQASRSQKGRKDKILPGRVGLRCSFCAHVEDPSARENGSAFFPRSVEDIYTAVTTMQRVHLMNCKYVPEEKKQKYADLKLIDKKRGRKDYWAESARKIGLVNVMDDNGAQGIKFVSAELSYESDGSLNHHRLESARDTTPYSFPSRAPDNIKQIPFGNSRKNVRNNRNKRQKTTPLVYDSDVDSVDPEECVDINDYI
uniref:Uncharacterized protein n=2 Tax=Leptocylindrus danicus TaxID=163516 RepID=A0A7S2PL47_9STRA|mmetsp:Transcript_5435/g.7988  ORF Transcript_5435/g.7988 Transcript_5435/m.7988 type:complete len:284 (+) Transcript_5435:227-1078(+)|eukprot:CAMPEP_0116004772 /NCGR_PEP_ID=MMETSP0321-20121206/789_1 /TAXON_ID=163516 /ORGANISM="Leptocylindrus danicus var. danicus, Strain B650" /LENGTH=283 /DNA_ID=CAMNT_0003473113 /DNA_START=206 /DNA_END=1057 /DNA_ORIENTATION=+